MNTNSNSRPVDPGTPLDDFAPARFLKATDLLERWKVQSLTVEICRVMDEETTPNAKDIDPATNKPRKVTQKVLYFRTKSGGEFPRGYLVSAKVDIQSLKSATQAKTAGELIGKKIVIMAAEYNQKAVLRISPMPPNLT